MRVSGRWFILYLSKLSPFVAHYSSSHLLSKCADHVIRIQGTGITIEIFAVLVQRKCLPNQGVGVDMIIGQKVTSP